MSRTHVHAPAAVKAARSHNAYTSHGYLCRTGRRPCDLGGPAASCRVRIPRWESGEPEDRRGNAAIEKRSGVRQALHVAGRRWESGDELEELLMPGPYRECLCWWCWLA